MNVINKKPTSTCPKNKCSAIKILRNEIQINKLFSDFNGGPKNNFVFPKCISFMLCCAIRQKEQIINLLRIDLTLYSQGKTSHVPQNGDLFEAFRVQIKRRHFVFR